MERQLAAQGMVVFLAVRSLPAAQEAADKLTAGGPESVHPIQTVQRQAYGLRYWTRMGRMEVFFISTSNFPGDRTAVSVQPGQRRQGESNVPAQYTQFRKVEST
jgi:hypothetical protein